MKYPLRRPQAEWWRSLCTSFLGKMSFKPDAAMISDCCLPALWQCKSNYKMRREPVFGVKPSWCGTSCFDFPLCCIGAVEMLLFLSAALRFSGRSGRKNTTVAAGSLDVVFQPRGSDWAGNKLLVVTQISISSAALWNGILLWPDYGHT